MSPRSPDGDAGERAVELPGPAGRLEARLRDASSASAPPAAAVLCHPNPAQGGTMHNKTIYRIARRLPVELGVPTLRFNFRGTGGSEGVHESGRAESADVTAGLDWLARRHPRSPLLVVGYSFGAVMGLRAGQNDERVTHLIALGLPLDGSWDLSPIAAGTKPRLFVHGENDEFGNVTRLEEFAASLDGPVELAVVAGAGHLFLGKEDEAVDAVVRYTDRAIHGP